MIAHPRGTDWALKTCLSSVFVLFCFVFFVQGAPSPGKQEDVLLKVYPETKPEKTYLTTDANTNMSLPHSSGGNVSKMFPHTHTGFGVLHSKGLRSSLPGL